MVVVRRIGWCVLVLKLYDRCVHSQYEFEENAKKGRIQLIKPSLIEDFVDQYFKLLSKGRLELVGTAASDINM